MNGSGGETLIRAENSQSGLKNSRFWAKNSRFWAENSLFALKNSRCWVASDRHNRKQGRKLGIRYASHASKRKCSGWNYGRTDLRMDRPTDGWTNPLKNEQCENKAGYTAADASGSAISLILAARLYLCVCACVCACVSARARVCVLLFLVIAAPLTH